MIWKKQSKKSVSNKKNTQAANDGSTNPPSNPQSGIGNRNWWANGNTANKIAFWSTLINVGMLVATYFIWKESHQTFKEVKRQFEIENRPYIISKAIPDTIRPQSDLYANCIIKNVGGSPALMLDSAKIGIGTYASETPERFIYDGKFRRGNIFLEVGDTISFPITGFLPNKPGMYNQIMQGKLIPLAYGEIRFKDVVSDKTYSYTFCIRILNNGRYVPTELNNRLV